MSRRLLRGIGANMMGIATRIVVQFATLPILFAHWSSERIGVWLLIFALPAYVAIVGTGFAGAGGSASLAAAQAGDQADARAKFRAAWIVTSLGTVALAAAFFLGGERMAAWLAGDAPGVARGDVVEALGWLALYILASSQMAVAEIPYRVAHRYPDHILLTSLATLAEVGVIALCVSLSQSLGLLAMALALARCLTGAAILLAARKACPTVFGGPQRGVMGQHVRALAKPSLAFMAMPVIFGLNLQGYLILVGARYGPAVVAAFAATRTLTRLLDLIANLTYGVHYYESGYLTGERRVLQGRVLATMTLVAAVLSLAVSAALLAAGPWLQRVYTGGETAFDPMIATVLLIAASLRALSSAPMAIVSAENRHAPIIALYLAGSVLSLALAAGLSAAGVPLALCLGGLILAEATQLAAALRMALRDLHLTPGAFARSLLSRERLADAARLVRILRRAR